MNAGDLRLWALDVESLALWLDVAVADGDGPVVECVENALARLDQAAVELRAAAERAG